MKKTMMFGMVAVLVAGMASAQNEVVMVDQMENSKEFNPEVTVEMALVSSYVWRGQVYNNDIVVQPQVTVSQYGVSLNVWGNYDLGKSSNGTSSDFSEIDFSLAYTLPIDIDEIAIDVGVIGYHFPANGSYANVNEVSKSTTELFAKATILSWADYVIPSVTFFGDIDEVDGAYILFDIVAPYQVSDYLWVEGGVSAGWGNTSYNDFYWGTTANPSLDKGFNDFNFYGNVSYEVMENVTASLNLTYTMLAGGEVRDSDRYESSEKFWGGVNLAYDF